LSGQTLETAANRWPDGEVHYLCRCRVLVWTSLLITIFVAPVLVFAWYLVLYPDWMPEKPDFSRRSRGLGSALIFWAFFMLFMKVPVWIRLPFLLWTGFRLTRLFGRQLIHAFDREPDFVISPDGVGGWDRDEFRFFPWSEISKLTIIERQNDLWGFKIGRPQQWIELLGPEVGPRRFFETFPPRRARLMYSQLYFPTKNAEILHSIGRHRPELVAQAIG
jgi:hypothetical protein